jgi:small subunit ribosomal protein S16
MAVVIRMKRSGRRNRPCYRITVADSRAPRDGRVLESLGLYDPIAPDKAALVVLVVERAKHWIEHGAQPSETVRSILKRNGVFGEPKPKTIRDRSGRKRKTKTQARRKARDERMAERREALGKAPRAKGRKQAVKAQSGA